jgi:hypothetical protein
VRERLVVRKLVPGEVLVRRRDVALLDAELLEHDVARLWDGRCLVEGEVAVEALSPEAAVGREDELVRGDVLERLAHPGRDDVREVLANFECGIQLAGFHDIQEGDIITAVNGQKVTTADEFGKLVAKAKKGEFLKLYIYNSRADASRFALVKIED